MEKESTVSSDTNEHFEEVIVLNASSPDILLKQSEVSPLKSIELNKIRENNGETIANVQNENNESDISDDETFQIMRIRTKPQTITDSDSEDLENSPSVVNTVEISGEADQCNEDTFSEITQREHLVSQEVDRTKKKTKRLTILDSDSEVDDGIIAPHLNSDSNEILKTTNHNLVIVKSKDYEKASWTALCDSDSDEDNQTSKNIQDDKDRLSEEEILQPTPYKKKNKPKTDENYAKTKMTGKEAAQQRREIQSESQRMVREMNVSLPYHRPKAFTLKEFLARRPKFSSAIPESAGTSTSVAIKMSKQQLEIISKKLKQHEKEVKEFYKSESEPEDNEDIDDEDYIPLEIKKNSSNQQTKISEENLTNDLIISKEHDKIDEIAQDSAIDVQEVAAESSVEVSNELVEKISDIPNEASDIPNEANQDQVELSNERKGLSAVDSNNESDPSYKNMENIDQNHIEIHAESGKNVEQVNEIYSGIDDIDANDTKTVEEVTTSEKLLETQTVECSSMEYEFNLDDIEENSEKILPVEKEIQIENDGLDSNTKSHNESYSCGALIGTNNESKKITSESVIADNYENLDIEQSQVPLVDPADNQPKKFEYTDLDREIENFGTIEEPPETEKPKLSRMDLIREKLANIRPRLSGGENEVIDLNREIARPNEVTKLMNRFVQHTTKIHGHKSKVKLNIVSVESGEIHKETVDMIVDEDEPMEIEEKPGAKLQKLRNELQNQMSIQRLQNWQKKIIPQSVAEDKDSYEGEKSDCEVEDAILDDDEEEEMSESSEEENEEEQEDNKKSERQTKSAFLDDEADESDREEDTEECNEADESEREEDIEEYNKAEDGDDEDEIDEDEKTQIPKDEESKSSCPGEEVEQKPVKKNMKRILKGFTEDSDEEEDHFDLASQRNVVKAIDNLNKNIEGEVTEDDEYLPPHQPPNLKTPVRRTTLSQSKSDFDFLTPVSYITGLNNLNSASKSKNATVVSPFRMPNMPSPLKELNWQANLQKKLFTDSEITNSQAEAIAELCSDKTSFTQEIDKADGPTKTVTNLESEIQCTAPVNTQDILNICSGEFVDSQEGISSSASPTSQDLLNLCSGEFTGVSQVVSAEVPQTPIETHTFGSTKEVKNLGVEEDLIISQLLDEEEMEKFKKKFDSPLMTNTQRRVVDEFEEVTASGGVIDSDDDDDEVLEVKKRSQKKLTFSDESSDEEQEEETIDLLDQIDEDEEDISPDNVGYDSEENEIEYINDKAKTADFFDKEAELSESEWGSADEDEKDLDTMEFEQGDTEKFDEKKMRSDLEKIHMKRMLDDDTREVKLLQELLLEDGELHGTGRERKFRWKNINSLDDTDGRNKEDDDVGYLEEEESEEQWRKKRHEIEMFLKEKQLKATSTEDDDDLLNESNSQLLKIGHKVIQNSFQESTPIEKPKAKPISPNIKSTFSFMNKRGSFLSRKDQVLQRITDYNKQTNTAVNSAKNSKNFLFQTVAVGETISTTQEKKRKATDGTPKVIKKLRLSDNMSPAVSRKKVDPPSAKAKLF